MNKKNKKCFSAVVATTLILILAVVTVAYFSSWFGNFTSKVITDNDEEKANINFNSEILTISNNKLFFKNSIIDQELVSIKIGNIKCSIDYSKYLFLEKGVNKIDLENCLDSINPKNYEVLLQTNTNLYKKTIYIE